MSYQLLFHPEFESDVTRIVLFIAENAEEDAALKASDRADEALAALADNPFCAAPRNDVIPGLRIALFRHSGVIPYLVDETREKVLVLGLFYGGQEWDRHILMQR
jgi:plasmid stabilization system protein ParE